jgi:hypothetical protein
MSAAVRGRKALRSECSLVSEPQCARSTCCRGQLQTESMKIPIRRERCHGGGIRLGVGSIVRGRPEEMRALQRNALLPGLRFIGRANVEQPLRRLAPRQADGDTGKSGSDGLDLDALAGLAAGDRHRAGHRAADGEVQAGVGRAAADCAGGVEGPLFPLARDLAVLLAQRGAHFDLVAARRAADGQRQVRARRFGRVVCTARDLLAFALIDDDLAVAAPAPRQSRKRSLGASIGRLSSQNKAAEQYHNGRDLMSTRASYHETSP